MAITILKSSKATPVKGMEYITNKGKAALVDALNLDPNRDYADQMMNTAMLWDKAQAENSRKYYHFKLSFDPKDWIKNGGTLTEQGAMDIGLQLVGEFFPDHESVGAVHTDKSHLHFHGMINAVNLATGEMIHMNDREYRQFKDRAQEICAERGLTTIDWREATAEKRAAEKQAKQPIEETFAEKGLKSRGKTPWKDELRVIIDDAVSTAKDMDEFKSILEANGVTLTRCTDKTISYKLGDHKACRGDSLGGDYTAQAIRDVFKHNQSKVSERKDLDDKIGVASKNLYGVINGQVMSPENREVFRNAGRRLGYTRAEIDELCDKATKATWEEKQAAWDAYRQAQADFWLNYRMEKERINMEYKATLAWKRQHRTFIEQLYHNHHRGVVASLFLLAVVLIKPELLKPEEESLKRLRDERTKLIREAQDHRIDARYQADLLRALNNYGKAMEEVDQQVTETAESAVQYSRQGRPLLVVQSYDR